MTRRHHSEAAALSAARLDREPQKMAPGSGFLLGILPGVAIVAIVATIIGTLLGAM